MNFDDIKDQLREQVNALWSKIQESSLYNNLREQYDSLPQIAQKLIMFFAGFIAVFIVLSIPYSYIDSAGVMIEEYDEHRTLLRDLLRIGRVAREPSPLPADMEPTELTQQVERKIAEMALIPEQIVGIQPLGDMPAGNLAPRVLRQSGVSLTVKKLNLNQIIDLGYRLQNISPAVKISGVDISANREDNHYYDMMMKVVSFSLPAPRDSGETSRGGSGTRFRGREEKTDTPAESESDR